ncbi:MAG: DUF5597 domain-containing protein [Janthinobacterium lividum]
MPLRLGARAALVFALLSGTAMAADPMPRIVHQGGRFELQVDGQPYFVLAGQMHNSSAWPSRMPAVWDALSALDANTLEAPVYWETMEPAPGQFDFSGVDMLLDQARAHHVRLVLLWFGTWKNGGMHYAPEWVRRDTVKYSRLLTAEGQPVDGLSPFGTETLARDSQAFAALMSHLKQADALRHTVIMVQVENESGLFGMVRDHGAAADAAFAGAVPEAVLRATGRQGGNWRAAFGSDAEEAFSAYAVSHYVNAVAEAGKAVYPLPLYSNAWMRYRGLTQPGTEYPSGGPSWTMLPIWKQETPALDAIGSDVYTDTFAEFRKGVLPYGRADNPPWVSESGFTAPTSRWVFDVLARGGIGCSQFGIDGEADEPGRAAALQAHGDNNRLLAPVASTLAAAAYEGRIAAFVQEPAAMSPQQTLGTWTVTASFGAVWGHPSPTTAPQTGTPLGRALVVRLDPTHFLVLGMGARVEFASTLHDGGVHEMRRVEEGRMTPAGWTTTRILNGDETDYGLDLPVHGDMLRVEVTP